MTAPRPRQRRRAASREGENALLIACSQEVAGVSDGNLPRDFDT
jgi:hypothetical protein